MRGTRHGPSAIHHHRKRCFARCRCSPRASRARGAGRRADAALNAVFERIFQEQVRTSPSNSPPRSASTRASSRRLRSRQLDRAADGPGTGRGSRSRSTTFIGWTRMRSPEAGLSNCRQAQSRSGRCGDLKTSNVGAGALRSCANPQSPVRDRPEERRLFLDAPISSTALTRSTARAMPRPICPASRSSRPSSIMTPPNSSAQAAPRRDCSGLGARPRRSSKWRELRAAPPEQSATGEFGRDADRGEVDRRRLARPRRKDRRRQGLSRARPADRGDSSAAARPRRAGDGVWRLPRRRRNLCRSAGRGDDHQPHAATKSTRSGLDQVAEISGAARQDPHAPPAIPQGTVGERLDGAQQVDPTQLYAEHRRRAAPSCSPTSMPVSRTCTRACRSAFATLPEAAARDPPRAARNPGRRLQRLLPPRRARWLAARRSTSSTSRTPTTGRKFTLADADLPRGRPGPSPPDRASRRSPSELPMLRKIGFLLGLLRRLGALCRAARRRARRLSRRSDRPRRLSSSPSCSAPRGSSSTPASTPSAGAANRRSIIWSRTTGFAAPALQREIERYCTPIGQACSYKVGHIAWVSGAGRRRSRRSATASTCKPVPRESCAKARCRSASSKRRVKERTAAQLAGSAPERG